MSLSVTATSRKRLNNQYATSLGVDIGFLLPNMPIISMASILCIIATLQLSAKGLPGTATSTHRDGPGVAPFRDSVACGPNCLYMMLRLAGQDVTLTDVWRNIRYDARGVSIADLVAAGESLGLPLYARYCDLSDLQGLDDPAIAYLSIAGRPTGADIAGHYVVIVDMDEDSVVTVDGTTSKVVSYPCAAFSRLWTGHLLVSGQDRSIIVVCSVLLILNSGAWLLIATGCLKKCYSPRPK